MGSRAGPGRPGAARYAGPVRSRNAEQLDFESERLVRRDGVAGAGLAVGEPGRDGELALAADFHAAQAFFPAVDDFFLAEGELEGVLLFAAGIELRAVGKPAGVVDDDVAAGSGGGAFAEDGVFDGQAAGGGDGGHGQFLMVKATLRARRTGFRGKTGRAGRRCCRAAKARMLRESRGISQQYLPPRPVII